jgi:CelD/BcsL family acetyltransferase involved in cellulose biosynthesis
MSFEKTPQVLPVTVTDEGKPALIQEQVQLQVLRDFAELDALEETWDGVVARLGGAVYMTRDWLETWWVFYGQGRPLRLCVFTANDVIVGLLPLYLDDLGRAPLRLRIARLVGSPIPPKVFDPPLDAQWAIPCLEQCIRRLMIEDHVDVVSLGLVSALNCPRTQVDALSNQLTDVAQCRSDDSEVYSLFRLPDQMADYWNSLSRNEQKKRKYEQRILNKAFAVRAEILAGPIPELLAEFDCFAEQHTRQWNSEGKTGHFGAWPQGLEYNRTLVTKLGSQRRVRFLRIWAGDQVVARQYVFAFAGRWWWELPSRIVGEQWNRFSLGPSALVTMLQEAIRDGVRQVEGGLGHYEYKLRLGAEEHRAPVFRAFSVRPGSRARQCLYAGLQWLLRAGYHKVWYRRVQPRLPSRWHRPQWGLWLRFDY